MTPPKRRSQTRQESAPPPPPEEEMEEEEIREEKKPMGRLNHSNDQEEPMEEEEERFQFSFQNEPMTAWECASKMAQFQTRDAFLSTVPIEECQRFLTKVMVGQKGEPLKCLTCDRMYVSATGYWTHFKKCTAERTTEGTSSDQVIVAQEYKSMPWMWLRVDRKNQSETLKNIVGNEFKCFSGNCDKGFKTTQALIKHLDTCIQSAYNTYMNRPEEFRKLDKKTKNRYARDAMKDGEVKCLVEGCGTMYSNPNALVYHVDRCGLPKSAQPWRCYRCGYEGVGSESEGHLLECARKADMVKQENMELKPVHLLFGLQNTPEQVAAESSSSTSSTSSKRRRTVGGTPRSTTRKDGSTLFRFRKSTVNREFQGIVSKEDQKSFEEICSSVYSSWKMETDLLPFCVRLKGIMSPIWVPSKLGKTDPFFNIFNRESVVIRTEKAEGLQDSVPNGIRIPSGKSVIIQTDKEDTKTATVSYCGAPINGIQVAPGKTIEGHDVICVTTFPNETDLESDSSVAQFWRHRVKEDETSEMTLWFLLKIKDFGTILSMKWLQKHDTSEADLIGFVAFSTSWGKVLIYRIDSTSSGSPPCEGIIQADPHLVLGLPRSQESSDDYFMNATIKMEGEDVVIPIPIQESTVPIIKIAWNRDGSTLAGITALGAIVIWNLNLPRDQDDQPRVYIGADWQSPPSDLSFLDQDHVVVGFREKLVKVINIHTWDVKLEDGTIKTAGSRVHTDPRIIQSFFTFQSEYNAFPYPNATSIAYIHMDIESLNLILIPTGNTHQLMAWDIAMCAPLGTLLSCGIDGRLIGSASGRLIKNLHHPFFANRNIIQLKRRRVLKEELLKIPKNEEEQSTSEDKNKGPLEESLREHSGVCDKMWLELSFDEPFEPPSRVELSCRDQRIESLNCVDVTTNPDFPVAFTGGEAGLLFAISSKLIIKNVKL